MARLFTIRLDGETHEIDDMELDEMIECQNLCGGVGFFELDLNDANVWKAFAYIVRKRTHPDVTMEEIGKLKGMEMLAGDEEMPPLPPSEGADHQNGSFEKPDSSGTRPSPVSMSG